MTGHMSTHDQPIPGSQNQRSKLGSKIAENLGAKIENLGTRLGVEYMIPARADISARVCLLQGINIALTIDIGDLDC
jgi:hypothetical protein